MKKLLLLTVLCGLTLLGVNAQRVTDNLNRGLVAIPQGDKTGQDERYGMSGSGIFVSWRILPTEYYDTKYNLYRGSEKIASDLTVSNYQDNNGTKASTYKVVPVIRGTERNDLAAHVYDITYGSLAPYEDNLVIIDDSIVRGTTLRESIFKILDRLHPKKIVMVSSSPQIRYPDYYGIDMSHLEELCAFRAAIALIKERGMQQLIADTYRKCKTVPLAANHVRAIYAAFTVEEINHKIVEMLCPVGMQAPIELVYQSIEGLHKACPNHPGDWYFTGHYPTPGGIRMVNQAFVNYIEQVLKLQL